MEKNANYILEIMQNPFPASMADMQHLRFIICGVLLAGVVIRNAFKSKNVYNIVMPRQRTPFQTTEELVYYNYKIYSRLYTFDFTVDTIEDIFRKKFVDIEEGHIEMRTNHTRVLTGTT